MRFFSNDKDGTEDQGVDVRARAEQVNPDQAYDDHPERVQSEPVAVPQQRAGSPWSSGPDSPDPDAARPADPDLPFHEPSPQPTAFGATTVGGAVAASATANPQNDTWSATDREAGADSGVGDDRSVAPGDGVLRDDPDRPAEAVDVVDVPLDDQGGFDDPHVRDAGLTTREDNTPPDVRPDETSTAGTSAAAGTLAGATVVGADPQSRALKDDGSFDAPQVVDPATDRPLDISDDSPASPGLRTDTSTDLYRDPAIRDEGTFDAPTAVDPATDQPLEPSAAAVPVVAAAAAAPAAAGSATGGSIFGADDAKTFQERWRDVQLRFVDSPKEATAEAAGLVDEAVDRLTSALRDQKGGLSQDSDDTERLRVELRGYRDILNRIIGL